MLAATFSHSHSPDGVLWCLVKEHASTLTKLLGGSFSEEGSSRSEELIIFLFLKSVSKAYEF